MTRDLAARRLLRAIAVAIAIAAAIDPAITSNRSDRSDVSVIAVDPSRDSALAAQVGRSLGSSFVVTAGSFAAAGATVLVGDRLPALRSELSSPVFAVTPEGAGPAITIESVRAPEWAPVDSRVPVTVAMRTSGTGNGKVAVILRQSGVVVDRDSTMVHGSDQHTSVTLALPVTAPGLASIEVTAELSENGATSDSAHADAAIEVRDAPLSVLSFDARPSWLATFVRRAAETDRRVTVTSRTITSRKISTSVGKAPEALDNLGSIDGYDAIVVGAPDGLTDRDVAGLEAFMRRRGGSVVLLLDQMADGPWQRLAAAGKWLDNGNGRLVSVGGEPGATALKASELAWPAHLPAGAEPVAFSVPAHGDSTPQRPVIWRSSIGAGELIVSGALDAWRYRDSSASGFDRFWRDVVVSAASSAAPPVSIALSSAIVAPNEPLDVTVNIRDAALRPLPVRAEVQATIRSMPGGVPIAVRLWPDGSAGALHGSIRAPGSSGDYMIEVLADGRRAESGLRVVPGAVVAHADGRALLTSWVATRGGITLPATQLAKLPAAIRTAIHPQLRRERWHPLRSPWWLLPFALALSIEWWLRRRRGLR